MRIAIALSHFWPTVGGAERQMFELARRWARAGCRVTVFTRKLEGKPEKEEVEGIEIRRSIRPVELGPLFGASFVASLTGSLLRSKSSWDVAVAGQAPWEAAALGLVHSMTGKPTVVRLANTGEFGDLYQCYQSRAAAQLIKLVRANSIFVTLCNDGRDELVRFGCRPRQIERVPNGVDVEQFRPPARPADDRAQTVLWVGRLAEQKNPFLAVRAWEELNRQGCYRLLIAGDGPLAEQLRCFVQQRRIKGVELLGHCQDIVSLYHRAGVFLLTSRSEGCSNALLEAMACGLCPVVSDIGPNRDVVLPSGAGLTVSGDERAWARALRDVLENKSEQRRLGQAARQYVCQHHDINRIADRWLGLLKSLLTG